MHGKRKSVKIGRGRASVILLSIGKCHCGNTAGRRRSVAAHKPPKDKPEDVSCICTDNFSRKRKSRETPERRVVLFSALWLGVFWKGADGEISGPKANLDFSFSRVSARDSTGQRKYNEIHQQKKRALRGNYCVNMRNRRHCFGRRFYV